MRINGDTICKEDLQAGRAWGNLGFKIADEIDRAMCAAEGIAALQRAADLVTLAEFAEVKGNCVEMYTNHEELNVAVNKGRDGRWCVGPDAIAEAAAWCRQRGGA
jgi:hypothetical protein